MKIVLTVFVFIILFSGQQQAQDKSTSRPEKWAKKVQSEYLDNWYKISDDVYRSEQPSKKAFKKLEEAGIKSVLNFRLYHTDNDEAKKTKLDLFLVKMDASNIKDDEVIEALKIMRKAKKPILIHCKHGADRTGVMCAMYRNIEQGWSKQEALDELLNGGYGFHTVFKNIPEYIKNVDIEKIKSKL